MTRKVLLAMMAGVLIAAPATASADVTADAVTNRPIAAEPFNTGSAVTDTIVNGLVLLIFGPDDPQRCKFPYCF
ncbi:hypothetical protein K7711_06065 [Nocardia sp. CA2R105]|uniref:hypothetical protein n=1 Tax=Nocardia coffeae TaxID=2873381 RepID=UPI001CA6C68F|nr:hypothetical protein [Nocardia coffeae]MBY8856036.1 hypothetical protein [Nocardia coffeae]